MHGPLALRGAIVIAGPNRLMDRPIDHTSTVEAAAMSFVRRSVQVRPAGQRAASTDILFIYLLYRRAVYRAALDV